MKVKVTELNSNPFKKFINNGKFDKERIDKLKESIEHGTLPENFTARKNDRGKYELTSGHHRLEAIKQVKGNDYEVAIEEVNYNDETMLIDMVRENLTQRETDFKDTEESIVLARAWLQNKCSTVKLLDSAYKSGKHTKGKEGSEPQVDSSRQIAQFLSKQGKMISHETIRSYLIIYDKLDPELHGKVQKLESATKEEREELLPKRIASELAQIEQEYQKPVFEQIKKEELNKENSIKAISAFKKAPEELKEKVVAGDVPITDIEHEMKIRDISAKLGLQAQQEQGEPDNISLKMEEILDTFIYGFSKIDSRLWDKGFISEFLMPNVPMRRAEELEKKMEHTIYEVLIPFYQELKLQIELRKEKS
jgi:hypothetical protein